MREISVNFAEHELILLADKAIWWPSRSALLLSDVHLGKGGIFRRQGVAIPKGHTEADLNRIGNLVDQYAADTVYVLGDLIHGAPDEVLLESVADWRRRRAGLQMVLILGNHDRYLTNLPENWQIRTTRKTNVGNLLLAHEPTPDPKTPEIVGHIHPAVRLRAGRNDSMRTPAFWIQSNRLILPAFGSFTGGHTITPQQGDRIFAIGPDQIMEIQP